MSISAGTPFGLYNVVALIIDGSTLTAASAGTGRRTEAAVRHVDIVGNEPCVSVDCVPSFAIFFLHVRGTGTDVKTQKSSYGRSCLVYA